jgi:hypothetical protein
VGQEADAGGPPLVLGVISVLDLNADFRAAKFDDMFNEEQLQAA